MHHEQRPVERRYERSSSMSADIDRDETEYRPHNPPQRRLTNAKEIDLMAPIRLSSFAVK
jgi:hypothetical protein